MGEVTFRAAQLADVEQLAATMRAADSAEVLASGGYAPRAALAAAILDSEFARVASIDGVLLCAFGVMAGEVWSIPWLLTTTAVERHPLSFWRASKVVLARIREEYPLLVQQVDARYPQALSWARRLGFDIAPAAPFGAAGLPFHRISIGAANV